MKNTIDFDSEELWGTFARWLTLTAVPPWIVAIEKRRTLVYCGTRETSPPPCCHTGTHTMPFLPCLAPLQPPVLRFLSKEFLLLLLFLSHRTPHSCRHERDHEKRDKFVIINHICRLQHYCYWISKSTAHLRRLDWATAQTLVAETCFEATNNVIVRNERKTTDRGASFARFSRNVLRFSISMDHTVKSRGMSIANDNREKNIVRAVRSIIVYLLRRYYLYQFM